MIDELIPFATDISKRDIFQATGPLPWKVLVVDDDPEVHGVTRFVLQELRIFGRPLRLLHAYDGAQAREHLRQHPDVAVALLDVVMETEQAGLDLVGYIRDELRLAECRIILRTGQPGYAPERTVIDEYDINDYRTKAELTHTRLITTVSAALRSYQQLRAVADNRRGLELIVRAAADLMEQHAISGLAEGVLTQLAALLKLPPDGVVCTQKGSLLGGDGERCYVVGAAGRHAPYIARPLEALPDRRIVTAILASVARGQHVFGPDYTVLYLRVAPHQEAAIFLDSGQALATLDRPLLEVFVANIAACFRNVKLVERLLCAQQEIEKQQSFLKTVIDADPHLIYVKDRQGRIVLANQSLAKRFGFEPERMAGCTFSDLISDPEFAQSLLDGDEAILAKTRDRIEREAKFVDQAGRTCWVYIVKAPIKNEAGEVEQLIGVGVDITERKRAEAALFEEKERAQVTLHSIGDAVITTDRHGIVEYLNPVAETLTGWITAEARNRPLQEVFRIIDEQNRQPVPDPVARCLRRREIVGLDKQAVLINKRGQEYHIDDSAAPIRGRDDQVLGAVLVFHDVTETRRLTRQLEYDATHDALTGLINRAEFERRLERALASAQQYGARHALCYLDLDQFKVVNDTAGHAAGDELLKQINAILSGMFRERDTLARIGGDEFGLLLDNCPLERAQLIAQAVVGNIRDHRFYWQGHTYQIGVSIGLVPVTVETQDTAQLLTQADVACYIAKETGRNRVHIYRREDTETVQRHSEILGAAGLRNFGRGRAAGRFGAGPVPVALPAHRAFARFRSSPDSLRGFASGCVQGPFRGNDRTGIAGGLHSRRRALRVDGCHRPLGDSGGVPPICRRRRPNRRPDRYQFIRQFPQRRDLARFHRSPVCRACVPAGPGVLRDHRNRRHPEPASHHQADGGAQTPWQPVLAGRFRQRFILVLLSQDPAGRLLEDRRQLRQGHDREQPRRYPGCGHQPDEPRFGYPDHRRIRS